MSAPNEHSAPPPSEKALGKRRARSFTPDADNARAAAATPAAIAMNPSKKPKLLPEATVPEESSEDEELYGNLPASLPTRLHITPPKIKVPWKDVYGGAFVDEDEGDEDDARPTASEPKEAPRPALQPAQPAQPLPPVVAAEREVTVVHADCEPVCPKAMRKFLPSTLSALDLELSQSIIGGPTRAPSIRHNHPSPTQARDDSRATSPADEEEEEEVQILELDAALKKMVDEHGMRVLDMTTEERVLLLLDQGAQQRGELQRQREIIDWYREKMDGLNAEVAGLRRETGDLREQADDLRATVDHYRAKVGALPTGLELERDIHKTKVDMSTAGRRIGELEYQLEQVVGLITHFKDHPEGRAVADEYARWRAGYMRGYEPIEREHLPVARRGSLPAARRGYERQWGGYERRWPSYQRDYVMSDTARGRSPTRRRLGLAIPSPAPTPRERRRMAEYNAEWRDPEDATLGIYRGPDEQSEAGPSSWSQPGPSRFPQEQRTHSAPAAPQIPRTNCLGLIVDGFASQPAERVVSNIYDETSISRLPSYNSPAPVPAAAPAVEPYDPAVPFAPSNAVVPHDPFAAAPNVSSIVAPYNPATVVPLLRAVAAEPHFPTTIVPHASSAPAPRTTRPLVQRVYEDELDAAARRTSRRYLPYMREGREELYARKAARFGGEGSPGYGGERSSRYGEASSSRRRDSNSNGSPRYSCERYARRESHKYAPDHASPGGREDDYHERRAEEYDERREEANDYREDAYHEHREVYGDRREDAYNDSRKGAYNDPREDARIPIPIDDDVLHRRATYASEHHSGLYNDCSSSYHTYNRRQDDYVDRQHVGEGPSSYHYLASPAFA